jgi:hypothetical protein
MRATGQFVRLIRLGHDSTAIKLAQTVSNPAETEARSALRILMPSIVDHAIDCNGASTVTRGLVKMLSSAPLSAQIDSVPVKSPPLRWRQAVRAASVIRAAASSLPAKATYVCSQQFQLRIQERLQQNQFHLVIINGGDLLWLLKYLPPSVPRIVIAHNVEHQLFEAQIRTLRRLPRLLRRFLDYDCRRFEQFEMQGLWQAQNVLFLSHEDAVFVRKNYPELNTLVVPPVFDCSVKDRSRCPGEVLEIGFVANMGWWPNQESLHWVLQSILPGVTTKIRLHLFGEYSERAPYHPWVVKHGVVADLDRIWSECDFVICPILSGGGVSVKFVEAVYNRIPLLATHRAARGLCLDHDPAIVLLDQQEEWVAFFNSPAARALAAKRISAKVAGTFAMENHAKALQKFVQGVLFRSRGIGRSGPFPLGSPG